MGRQPYCLTDDIDILRNRLLGTGETDGGNRLGVVRTKALDEFSSYASCYDLSNPEIAHKYSHTLRVTQDADEIARRARSGESLYDAGKPQTHTLRPSWLPDRGACFLMGLLHDIGRFPQYAMYGTYSDMASFPHAEMSYVMLSDFKMIGKFVNVAGDDSDGRVLRDRVLRAVRCHSLLSIDGVRGSERAYYDILRDADRIDILEAYCHAISSPDFKMLVEDTKAAMGRGAALPSVNPADAPFINEMARMEDLGFSISDAVLSDVRKGGLVDRRNIRTAGDAILSCLAMYLGMETAIARRILEERGTMSVIEQSVIETYGDKDATGTLGAAVREIAAIR